MAARFGPQLADRHREARVRVHLAAGHVGRERGDVELDVGSSGFIGQGAHEAPALVDADRERPAAEQQPLQADLCLAEQRVQLVVGRDRLSAFVAQTDLQVILQVFADTGRIDDHRNAVLREQRVRADARELQQLRRLQRACREQHLGVAAGFLHHAALPVTHADGAGAVHDHAGGERIGLDAQVRATPRRVEVGFRGADPPALVRVQLEVAGAFLLRAVEVVGARHTDLLRAADEGLDQLVLRTDVRHLQRPFAAVQRNGTALVAFRLDEIRQHLVVTPTGVAERGPVVVIFPLAADVDQAVDRARTAERLAARPVDAATVHVRVGIGQEAPVVLVAPHRLAVADRQMNPERVVGRAGLEQQHARARVFAQAGREHAACGACANDDVVEILGHSGCVEWNNAIRFPDRIRAIVGVCFPEHNVPF